MKKFLVSIVISGILIGGFLSIPAEAKSRDCVKEWKRCMKTLKGDRESCTILWNYCHTHIA